MTDNASLRPAQGSHWRHSNGNLYRVEEPTNVDGDRPRYLEHVVYRNIHNGKLYTRELQDWHRSMTLVPDAIPEIPSGMIQVMITRDASVSYIALVPAASIEEAKANVGRYGYDCPEDTVWQECGINAYDNLEQAELTDSNGTSWTYTPSFGWFQE